MGTVISFFTGKSLPIIIGGLIALILNLGWQIYSLNSTVKSLGIELTKKEVIIKDNLKVISDKRAELKLQSAQVEANRVDFEAKLLEASKNSVVIKDRYKVIYRWVEAQKGDTNETSCNNARSFLNNVTW